ncbi:NRAMP family divalent metal transporter [Alysiella filiformis]|uniref:Mn2+ and Fe2+ transporters of the NRAMP family n=1 Tax=Alysiella filiformis DSM 16848 TaxID=1120981 RepID=A0A286E575_9NEIS|nr:NRAMP family divalent metal transporter [Alysiella filiformis]QMT30412.1 divalent metal cation transporter [Alysiella filiformis]UBQ56606.1 divalent metal cation transporter [Alysiella filiformis DSM 16848]SOD66046.1 Mn2+ and Fe2+ transporters of the NRAMP family [Alysiella filiformis DSM 16848]
MPQQSSRRNALLGAAFLMATSAIGPGFLTQTATFTQKLAASFGFVILLSILLDIGAQLNIWRIIAVSEKRAQDIANEVFPYAGYFLALLIVMGGLAFNIGNVGGAGMGLNLLMGITPETGAIISGAIAIGIFLFREAGKVMDKFAQIMGFVMIALTVYVAFQASPPVGEAVARTFVPEQLDAVAIVTLVGGTVGGYITFAGAHRLLDAGIKGKDALPEVSRSSVTAILVASVMRVVLFLAVLGVVSQGVALDKTNPAATPFQHIAGTWGLMIFGVVIWAASITSVIGAAYTSVSFISGFSPSIERNKNAWIIAFIVISTAVLATIGRPAQVLVLVGTLNGFILPIALGLILLAAHKSKIVGDYKHPVWLTIFGAIVAISMAVLSVQTFIKYLSSF